MKDSIFYFQCFSYVLGENLTSTANLKIPSIGCDNCDKKSNSVSFLNVSLRRRNIPSPIFDDDSIQSLNNSEFVEPVPIPSTKPKSISDELLEVKSDDKETTVRICYVFFSYVRLG